MWVGVNHGILPHLSARWGGVRAGDLPVGVGERCGAAPQEAGMGALLSTPGGMRSKRLGAWIGRPGNTLGLGEGR